jgi:hypothetical protein
MWPWQARSVVDTSRCEGFPDPISVPDGADHDWRDQRPGAAFEPAGASRVAGLVQCCGYDGYGADGQCEQEGDPIRVHSDGPGWLEQTRDHVQ